MRARALTEGAPVTQRAEVLSGGLTLQTDRRDEKVSNIMPRQIELVTKDEWTDERSMKLQSERGDDIIVSDVSDKVDLEKSKSYMANTDSNGYGAGPQSNNEVSMREKAGAVVESNLRYDVGDVVEVWSNSQQAWCPGFIKKVSGTKVTAEFALLDNAPAKKVLSMKSRELRPFHVPS
jgi:hypothetical protein